MLIVDTSVSSRVPSPSIFLHGISGNGKSTWATTGGTPLVILTEPKAMATLLKVNPAAMGLVPQGIREVRGILALLGELHNPTGPAMAKILDALGLPNVPAVQAKLAKIDRIVLDSFTDLTYTLPAWMKDPEGKEILHKMEIQEFGDLKNYALAVVKAIHLTGLPSIIIARSTVKRVGRVEMTVPDGYGKSVEELPGKCLPTVEARRNDEGLYWIDSSADECSQRCGVPWVPAIFKGTASEMIALMQAQGAEPLPQRDMETPIGEALQQVADAKRAQPQPVSQEASDFVDALTPAPQVAMATSEDAREVLDMALAKRVNTDQLLAYAIHKGWAPGASPSWMAITKEGCKTLLTFLQDDQKLMGLQAHLTQHFPAAKKTA